MIRAGLTLAAAFAAVASAYRAGPPPAHTGAFGEPDCGACHFDSIRDDADGGVAIQAPNHYTGGHSYTVRVEVRRPGLPAAGFQLTTRFSGGPRDGEQAGTLEAIGRRSQVQVEESGVAYASHTGTGIDPTSDGIARWELRWTAPAEGTVAFDVAAQAANDDDSEFGERYYTTRHIAGRALEKQLRD